MKRNLDLIRFILLKVEESPEYNISLSSISEGSPYNLGDANYNTMLRLDAGFLKVAGFNSRKDNVSDWNIVRMTNKGHDYLDAVRSPSVWKETKERIKEKAVDLTLEGVMAVAVSIAKSYIGI